MKKESMRLTDLLKLYKDITLAKVFKRKIPLRVKHHITYRCNLACPFCLLLGVSNNSKITEMTSQQIKQMMLDFKKMGTRFWSFSGGEPLLREDLGGLINYAKEELGFYCSIATNGVLLAEKIKEESSFKQLDMVQISLDGLRETHDKLRGKGVYDKIIPALEALKKLRIRTVLISLISSKNTGDLVSLIKLASEYNANIAFQAMGAYPSGPNILKEELFPSKEMMKEFIDNLIEAKKKNSFIVSSFTYFKMLKDCWPDIPHKIRCYGGQFYCDISPYGHIFPCCAKVNLTDSGNNGLNSGFENVFFQITDMSKCKDCYYAGPQELNIILEQVPFKWLKLYNNYCSDRLIH